MFGRALALSVISPHGFTDLDNLHVPKYAFGIILARFAPSWCRRAVLVFLSILHVEPDLRYVCKDYRVRVFWSTAMHACWIVKHWTALFYLALIHTPIHYWQTWSNSSARTRRIIALGTVLTFLFCMGASDLPSERLWCGPVIGHILNRLDSAPSNTYLCRQSSLPSP